MDEIRVDIYGESEEARRANELARELITERAHALRASDPSAAMVSFSEAMNRVLGEVLEPLAGQDIEVRRRTSEQVAYLVSALCLLSATGVYFAGYTLDVIHRSKIDEEELERVRGLIEPQVADVLETIAQFMIRQEQSGPML